MTYNLGSQIITIPINTGMSSFIGNVTVTGHKSTIAGSTETHDLPTMYAINLTQEQTDTVMADPTDSALVDQFLTNISKLEPVTKMITSDSSEPQYVVLKAYLPEYGSTVTVDINVDVLGYTGYTGYGDEDTGKKKIIIIIGAIIGITIILTIIIRRVRG